MLKYRGSSLIRAGFIGLVLIILVIVVGLQPERMMTWASAIRHQAVFAEAGGLAAGNDVVVAGIKVGTVSEVSLLRGDALVTFMVNGTVRLGSETTAHIRTGTLLGQRVLTLEPEGAGKLRSSDVIPLSRTGSPYSLTDSVNDFTANTADTNTATLNQALDTLSDTLDRVTPQLGPTFDGVSALSRMLNERNDSLAGLLDSAAKVTGVLSQRSEQVNTLLLNANDLFGVLDQRRYALVNLLTNTSALSKQISAMVHDNEKTLAPALEKINSVTAMLQKNNDNIVKALNGLAKYQLTQAEAVNNGFYYNAFVGNLLPAQTLQPFLDYALGFRRGTDAGQPADNAGPRAEFPFPRNGIPQPAQRWGQP
ncbi:MCE family protein [Mycobacterium sp. SA01]|uniref:MCE family protein n=1 Tax=Mycobacterium sp. SA01 TaxID=3238820 RepID=UPI00351BB56A